VKKSGRLQLRVNGRKCATSNCYSVLSNYEDVLSKLSHFDYARLLLLERRDRWATRRGSTRPSPFLFRLSFR
jgi:hypothetical protein